MPPWDTRGNDRTNPANNFLGTTDNQPLAIRTNGAEALRVGTTGNVGPVHLCTCAKAVGTDLSDGPAIVQTASQRRKLNLARTAWGALRSRLPPKFQRPRRSRALRPVGCCRCERRATRPGR
jgi:hypothetical protein